MDPLLMQDALPDIDRIMKIAKDEGVDEKDKATRLNEIFSARNIRLKRMKNSHGALSPAATDGYAKCPDMTEMRILFQLQSETNSDSCSTDTTSNLSSDVNYDLIEDVMISAIKQHVWCKNGKK
ncbi:unnamed protein product [Adineta ricciae]|uniref:Uncharacterized protein n=1 Tax=Adineta ricciae TaxID=249248 RepID=A0A815KP34_ADIRI|nr:unnamed protein product [Adineta ricciae]CAF1481018.1 unnamed protein product [Adineta ricciae]